MSYSPQNQPDCPVCGNSSLLAFWQVDAAPVFCNVLYETREQALEADCAAIRLAYCNQCDLIYNAAFNPALVAYCPDYENSLHFSPHFQGYAQGMAQELVGRHDLYQKDIVEIGCGQGDFLEMLQSLGDNRCVGFDPSYSAQKQQTGQASNVKIVSEFYSSAHADWPADFICCRHVLEHIEKPLDFLTSLRQTIGDKVETIVYFEVPNALYTLKDLGIWDIIYEHCSYFTGSALAELFRRGGFEPIRVAEQYQGQFLTIEAKPTTQISQSTDPVVSDTARLIESFRQAYQEKFSIWQEKMATYQQSAQKVVLWGAGSKGVTFLNALKLSCDQIPCIVDLNPRKLGKRIAGTGQRIVAPESLIDDPADVVIVMNPVYKNEIQTQMAKMGLRSAIHLA